MGVAKWIPYFRHIYFMRPHALHECSHILSMWVIVSMCEFVCKLSMCRRMICIFQNTWIFAINYVSIFLSVLSILHSRLQFCWILSYSLVCSIVTLNSPLGPKKLNFFLVHEYDILPELLRLSHTFLSTLQSFLHIPGRYERFLPRIATV